MSRILIVEDEPGIAFALENDLETEGYEIAVVADGVEAVRRARSEPFDLILLDVMLPNKDGFEVCRELRRGGLSTPIIMLTAKTQEAEKILGLDLGADDYVTKPFSPRELRARIRAMFRRAAPEAGQEVHRFGRCELDLARFELRREGQRLDATHTELKLLTAFIRSRGRVLTRERLLEEVWGSGVFVTDRVVDNHIVALRKKIEDDPAAPRYLISIRGVGYRFDG
ncbi:Transcriptional regulatory protein WalR [Candidatus Sulfopaludibacter sp. SbA4]|nr:Transcriptional regulatory protein WalR [Candidatus Sulfopaludibacter sp. SbA4]